VGGRPGLAGDGTVLPTGTLIVLLMTALELWVAADSQVIAIGAQQGSTAARCKIHRVGAVFYAEAGLLQDTSGRYHAAAIDRVDCPSDCPSAGTWAFLGGSEALTQFLEAHPRELIEHGARATRLRLLALEATAHPDRVRPPVDLLHLGPEGPTWVQRQPSCPPFPSP